MSEKIILLFEFISTILFSLEYFLYKNQIDLIGKDFSKQLREFRKSQKKDFKQANLKIKNSSRFRNILKALLSVIFIVISGILLPIFPQMTTFLVILIILLFVYTFLILPFNRFNYLILGFSFLYANICVKFLYSIKKGVLVGLGLLILLFVFLGKFINLIHLNKELENIIMLIITALMIFLVTFICFVLKSYIKYKKM